MAYIVCWALSDPNQPESDWEIIDGEDAMHIRVSDILNEDPCATIRVFDEDSEIDKNTAPANMCELVKWRCDDCGTTFFVEDDIEEDLVCPSCTHPRVGDEGTNVRCIK